MRQSVPSRHRAQARAMRADATQAENMLWQALRGKKLEGLKFRRQCPLHGFILDFVGFEAKLILALDRARLAEKSARRISPLVGR